MYSEAFEGETDNDRAKAGAEFAGFRITEAPCSIEQPCNECVSEGLAESDGTLPTDDDAPEPKLYSVIVGNVGTVYAGDEPHEAQRQYSAYVELSRGTIGRASGEPVTLMCDGEPISEHAGDGDDE
jgi:hypothetical protein